MPDPQLPFTPATLAVLRDQLCGVVGPVELAETLAHVARDSRDAHWQHPARHGLWIVGTALNGDAWAIDVQEDERVVILSHDLLRSEEVDDPREAAIAVAPSLAAALELARAGALPRDSYEAKARQPADEAGGEADVTIDLPDTDHELSPEARAAVLVTLLGPGSGVEWDDLEDALYDLGPMERAVLRQRHGLAGARPLPLAETALALGIPQREVKELEKAGVSALRRLLGVTTPRR